MRKPRKGEFVCTCSAYKFPHRFGGGKCRGKQVVSSFWSENYGDGECTECLSIEEDEYGKCCQIEEGREKATECPILQEFISGNEIRLLGPYWKSTKL